jgi:hypothetical protein
LIGSLILLENKWLLKMVELQCCSGKGQIAGFDPVMGKVCKRYMSGGRGSRKLWTQYLKTK